MMLKLKTGFNGVRIRETPVDGKPIGQIYAGDLVESQEAPDETERKINSPDEWLKIKAPNGTIAYIAARFLVPDKQAITEAPPPTTTQPQPQKQAAEGEVIIRVKTTVNGLRLRETPVDGKPVGQATIEMLIISLESPEETRKKLGQQDQWLQVRTPTGVTGYTAAWLLTFYDEITRQSNITGINLDVRHPLGSPEPARLDGLGWVRLAYSVSDAKGSEDIDAAYERYAPVIEQYANAGLKVMLVFTHQTYGEGKDEFWPWPSMTTDKWRTLTGRLADMVKRIVSQYADQNVIHAYQVWNEQDARIGAVASVPMQPTDYAIILGEVTQAIKSSDPNATVITGGHTGGPEPGSAYAKATLDALPSSVELDGVAFHPYGRGLDGQRYAVFGHIQESMAAYTAVMPDKPVWITEWGVLDRPNDPPQEILAYAKSVTHYLRDNYPGQVAALIWYAWAMSMHNGYGLVNKDDAPILPLYDGFIEL